MGDFFVKTRINKRMASNRIKMIDPPKGWIYGFPKPIPDDVKDPREWLVKNGYPKKLIDDLGEHFYCRYWEIDKKAI